MCAHHVREAECTIFLTVLSESRIYRLGAETVEDTADWARAFELATSGQDKAVLKMGFLHRQVLGAWSAPRPQWFVLDRGALFYFKQPPDFTPTAALKLDRTLRCVPRDGPPSATGEPDGYEFDLESSAKLGQPTRWTLRAETAAGRDDWVHAIGAAVDALPMATEVSSTSVAEQRGWLLKLTRGIGGSGLLTTYQPRCAAPLPYFPLAASLDPRAARAPVVGGYSAVIGSHHADDGLPSFRARARKMHPPPAANQRHSRPPHHRPRLGRYIVLKGNALGYYTKPADNAPPRGAL